MFEELPTPIDVSSSSAFNELTLPPADLITPAYSLTPHQGAERLLRRLEVREDLRDMVQSWGLRGDWFDLLHSTIPSIVMIEQTNPLPTVMSALDTYGSPEQLHRMLLDMDEMSRTIEGVCGIRPRIGMSSLPYEMLTFNGITGSSRFATPVEPQAKEGIGNLYSGKERKTFGGSLYRDAYLSPSRIEALARALDNVSADRAELHLSQAASDFAFDLRVARGAEDGALSHFSFVRAFNSLFARRFLENNQFEVVELPALDLLPILGGRKLADVHVILTRIGHTSRG